MIYHEVEVNNCQRFYVGKITTLNIVPEEKTQLVLGSNGTGKSSLMEVGFSVLPVNSKVFGKVNGYPEGYVRRRVEHEDKMYQLTTSASGGKTEHEFIVDGENLNPGKTVGVQADLVAKHFRITPDIQALLTNKLLFTRMGPAERQKWIIKLADNDFSYVLGFYDRAKSKLRKNKILLEEYGSRLSEEVKKLTSEDEVAQLTARQAELNRELSILHRLYNGASPDELPGLTASIEQRRAKITEEIRRRQLEEIEIPPEIQATDLESLHEQIKVKESEVNLLNGRLHEVSSAYEEVHRQMRRIEELSSIDVQSTLNDLSALKDQRAEVESQLIHCKPGDHQGQTKLVVMAIDELVRTFSAIGHIDLLSYQSADHRKLHDEWKALDERRRTVLNKREAVEHKLDHIKSVHSVDCPKCQFGFKPGVDENELNTLQRLKEQGDQVIETITNQLAQIQHTLDTMAEAREALNTLSDLIARYPQLSSVSELLKSKGLGFRHGLTCIEVCNEYRGDMGRLDTLAQLLVKIAPLEAVLERVSKGRDVVQGVESSYQKLKAQVEELSVQVSDKSTWLRTARKVMAQLTGQQEMFGELSADADMLEKEIDKLLNLEQQLILGKAIGVTQTSLAIVSEALNTYENQQTIVKDLQNRVTEYTEAVEVSHRIVAELSPATGLIAEQVMIYINTILDVMNQIIASICHYPLVINPCDIEAGELNYRFPMWAAEETNIVDDVSMGSTGQQEIIDLAFKLTAYHFLRLKGYPLYLDEVGRAFDPINKQNLLPVLSDLIADDSFSQVFIISHDVGIYSSLDRVDVIVLDPSTAPPGVEFNRNVSIV